VRLDHPSPTPQAAERRGATLLALARDAISSRLEAGPVPWGDAPWLDAPGATFVSLHAAGELRGCVGSLEAWRALREDVRSNAVAAAFRDTRFPPLDVSEWVAVRLEVSELTAPRPLPFASTEELLASLRPGRDGLILERGGRRATFLPQVWEQLPDPRDFVSHLLRKAGLPPGALDATARAFRYEVVRWSEDD